MTIDSINRNVIRKEMNLVWGSSVDKELETAKGFWEENISFSQRCDPIGNVELPALKTHTQQK